MRYLIGTYIQAKDSRVISAFDDLSLIQLIVERGVDAVQALPNDIREDKKAVAETIENNGKAVLRGKVGLDLYVRPGANVAARDRVLQRWYRERLRAMVPRLLAKWEKVIGVTASFDIITIIRSEMHRDRRRAAGCRHTGIPVTLSKI